MGKGRYFCYVPAIGQYVRGLGFLLVAGGLAWSHSLISVGVGLLAVGVLADRRMWGLLGEGGLMRLHLPFVGLYVLHALSWFYTENAEQWWVEMRIKLPMLFLLPAAAVSWHGLPPLWRKVSLVAFHGSVLSVGLLTLGKVLANPTWALEEMRHSRYVPMVGGISHIYYAGLVGVGVLGLWIFPHGRVVRYVLLGLYAGVLHGLALRTGLVALYLTGALGLGWTVGRRNRLWAAAVLGAGMLGVVLLVRYFPPLRARWESLKEDLASYRPGGYITYASVGRRLAALEASWCVFLRSPLWGVGIADNQDAVFAQIPRLPYQWDKEWYILPHNQFVEYAVGLGLIGLGVFALFWVGALRERLGLLWVLWLVYWFLLLQGEAFLERQVGITAFLWGTGWVWAQLKAAKS
uniref:Lipid A core--O-antigen ligase n=1 Tax=uncultured Bacteroidota bacterium TaxID=152509 RepID=H5SNV7_9BACT|nr:lipid A core--O-antigen ligase [uncultured Bacteroidetes bacterium]